MQTRKKTKSGRTRDTIQSLFMNISKSFNIYSAIRIIRKEEKSRHTHKYVKKHKNMATNFKPILFSSRFYWVRWTWLEKWAANEKSLGSFKFEYDKNDFFPVEMKWIHLMIWINLKLRKIVHFPCACCLFIYLFIWLFVLSWRHIFNWT